jgi:hypothetical protein
MELGELKFGIEHSERSTPTNDECYTGEKNACKPQKHCFHDLVQWGRGFGGSRLRAAVEALDPRVEFFRKRAGVQKRTFRACMGQPEVTGNSALEDVLQNSKSHIMNHPAMQYILADR